jgi:hypothetical protein
MDNDMRYVRDRRSTFDPHESNTSGKNSQFFHTIGYENDNLGYENKKNQKLTFFHTQK